MGLSLYTSRIVLKALGVEDFGVYNLVGGVVVLFSFLNNAMLNATQRYINVEIAAKEEGNVNKIFNLSLFNHFLISVVFLCLAETIGLWFLNEKLNIPSDRIFIANIVFQFSIVTALIDIVRVPFNAIIIANEKMSFYAILGVFEAFFKLAIAVLLLYTLGIDKLFLYSFLILLVSIFSAVGYYIYCRKFFKDETKFRFYRDYTKSKELFFFSGWSLLGQVSAVSSTQGINMIFNMFLGVTINASFAIANQVNGAIYNFVSNFQLAFNPQIVQTYASRDIERHKNLVLATSKMSFILLSIISAPVVFFAHSILVIWLGKPLPIYVESFVQIIIICSFFDALGAPFWMSINAIGKIKIYNIVVSLSNFLVLLLGYVLLNKGYNVVIVFWSKLIILIIILLYRFVFLNKNLKFSNQQIKEYFITIFVVIFFLLGLVYYSNDFQYNIIEIILGSLLIVVLLCFIIYLICLNKDEKLILSKFFKRIKILIIK